MRSKTNENILGAIISLGLIVLIYGFDHQEPTVIIADAKATTSVVLEEESTTATVEIVTADTVAEATTEETTTEEQATANELVSLGNFKLTAYCPCTKCSGQWGTQTSTGAIATEGRTIAVDPKVIPYGTVVVINGHEYTAEDTGGAIKENRIDIFFNSHTEALKFGVQYAEVFIKEGR